MQITTGNKPDDRCEVSVRVLDSFDDPGITPTLWSGLLSQGDTDQVSLTWQLQRLWWNENERPNALHLISAERSGRPAAMARRFSSRPEWQ